MDPGAGRHRSPKKTGCECAALNGAGLYICSGAVAGGSACIWDVGAADMGMVGTLAM